MSKAKKGTKASAETSNWEEGLLNEVVDDDCWSPCLVFLAPDRPLTEPHLQALVATADGGNRRKFAVVDKESMLQSAREDAKLASASAGGGGGGKKSKQGSTAPVEKPLYVEVCEHVVTALQGGGVPPALVAKMLKYKILRKRTQDIAMDALKKEAEEASKQQKPGVDAKGGKKGVAGSGRTSKMAGSGRTSKMAGGKKGKETPALEATPTVSIPPKPPTSMKKRGEEDLDSKYIDDEPAGGPSCYFLLTGFTSAEVFQHLTAVKLTAHALVKVEGQEETLQSASELGEEEETSELQQQAVFLQQFWEEINHSVKATPSGSMLRDMARLDLEVTQVGVPDNSEEKVGYGQSLFDTLAHRIYLLLEQRKQYQHYIGYLDIFSLPLGGQGMGDDDAQQQPGDKQPAEVVPTVDMRWYKALMGCVPDSCCSIPLMLHCMVEQVSATLSNGKNLLDSQTTVNGVDPAIMVGINTSIAALALSAKDKQELLSDDAKPQLSTSSCLVIPSGDDSMRRLFHLENSPQLQISTSENATNKLSILGSILTPPLIPCEEAMKQSARLHSLEHFCLSSDISCTFLNHALILLSLEHIYLSNASTAPMLCSDEEQQQANTNLLFDYPFSFSLKESSGASKALVPVSEATNVVPSDPSEGGVDTLSSHQYDLDLPEPHSSLEKYSFCELLKKEVLLQLLQSLQQTHPYIEVFRHYQSQSVVLVVHAGFDGSPIHKYDWSSQAHSRVGFHHYLEHVADHFGSLVDKAVAYDVERKKAYDAEKQKLIEQKLEAMKQEEEASPSNDDKPKSSAKGSKKGSAISSAKKTPSAGRSSPGKKSKLASKECTPAVSTHDVTASLPEFEEQKLFPAYDIGDTVLLTKGSVTTQFTADGSQIRTEHCQFVDGPMNLKMSLLNRGHMITASLLWQGNDKTKDQEVKSKDNIQIANDGEKEEAESEDGEKPPPVVIAGIPQPPPSVALAFLYASFNNSLSLALSHYGPKGNGEHPYSPPRPSILDEASRPDSSLGSRPQSQQGASSQKLSKKQQEQQQQLLEQQRLLEEQREKEKKIAEARFQEQQNTIARHNKYQQLFASMPYGLHVHCQSMVDLEADPSLSDGSDGYIVVRQSYVTKTKGMQRDEEHLLTAAFTEKQRYYLPDGLVVRILVDDVVVIECADGSIYRTATQGEAEHFMQVVASAKDQGVTPELEKVLTEAPARIESATKVKFADADKVALEKPKTMEKNIWVVTSSSGQKYLWKSQEESLTTVGASQTAEEGNGPMEEEESDRQEPSDHVGRRCQIVPLLKVGSFPATDPVTKEALIIREDGVTLLYRPDGSYIAEHSDGTRFTTYLSPLQKTATSSPVEKPTKTVIECPGFARVVYHSEPRNCKLHFSDGSEIACSRDGSYTVSKAHDYLLQIASSGKAVFTPTEGMQQGKPTSTFTVDHTGSGEILRGSDRSGNTFIVDHEGKGSVDLGGGSEIPKHPAFDPRYFVVHADGTSLELLKDDNVSSVITKAKSSTKAVVLHEDIQSEPHCTSTTVLEPCEGGGKSCLVPYQEESIVPVNLRASQLDTTHSSGVMQKVNGVLPELQGRDGKLKKNKFGVGVGKGLIIGSYEKPPAAELYIQPEAIQFRHFLRMQPVSNSLRMQLLSGVAAYAKWCQKQEQEGESVLPVDERDGEEKLAAEELQVKWCSHLTNEAVMQKAELPAKYRQEVTKESDQTTTKPVTKVHKATEVSKAVKWELEEAKATRQALRHHHIPPYFESEDGKQYLRSQSPDLKFLASKLAYPRQDSKQSASGHSTPSTLHSASMTLPHEELESPTQSEIDEVGPISSLSNLRPSHPTPDHAQGNATPTELRPTNPTPSHALKVAVGAEQPSLASNDTNSCTPVKPTNMEDICASRRVDAPENHKYVTVTHQLSSSGITPNSTHRVGPKEKPNTKFAVVEEPVRRKVRTSSTSGVGAVRGFLLQPEQVDFGVLSEGCTYAFTVVLKNTGIDSCRFKIKQPPPSTGVKVIYTPGPVAAGMSRSLIVEIFAMAVGVVGECGVGSVQHEVEIVSEAAVMYLPVKATILTSSAYEHRLPAHPQGREAAGVRIISDRPTSRETLTRPQRPVS